MLMQLIRPGISVCKTVVEARTICRDQIKSNWFIIQLSKIDSEVSERNAFCECSFIQF